VKLRYRSILLSLTVACAATVAFAQDPPAQDPGAAPPQQGQGRMREGQNGERPLFGKITAVKDGALEVTGQDGQAVTVKLTPQTEFRKDRQPAKLADFKVGDMVMVRGPQNPDHTVTAQTIGARTGGGPGGPGGGGQRAGGGAMMSGTLGKDYVLGEVKAIDPPRITVLRTDNVTQTLELNEETTLRRGRDSITMADIQVGDHLMARGAVANNVFVPKGVNVMNPEQRKRMQEFAAQANGANGEKGANAVEPATAPPPADAPASKP
jgi:Domain of unknown function (DUF5666)